MRSLPRVPDVRERLGELTDRAVDARGVAARDDERALLAERLLHELDEALRQAAAAAVPIAGS